MENILDQYVEATIRGKGILDLVLCNEKGLIDVLLLYGSLGNNDHNTV